LIGARTYLQLAPSANLLIVDNGKTIGGVWSREKIYPNLFAQVGYGMFEYSFLPMKRENVTEDRYISGETVHNYLNDFAKNNDLVRRLRLETHVERVEKLPGGGWKLNVAHGSPIVCDKLIYASGPTSHPVIPKWPRKDFDSPIIHSSETGTHMDQVKSIERATVVGAAKSSYDTVYLLLAAGKKVDWIIREDGSGPLAITPPRYFGFNAVDFCSTRAAASFSPSIMNTTGIWYRFFQRTTLGMWITMIYWRVATWLGELHAGYAKSENASKLRPIPEGYGYVFS
jgi:dimethylaniline monooxygenase (N-oxide forming)